VSDDTLVLGANPFVGLTPGQARAALVRFAERAAAERTVAVGVAVDAARQLMQVAAGRADVAPERGDRRFSDSAWKANPIYRRLM
jgi:polyhydroxyalkanoate synthase subunit PhaC